MIDKIIIEFEFWLSAIMKNEILCIYCIVSALKKYNLNLWNFYKYISVIYEIYDTKHLRNFVQYLQLVIGNKLILSCLNSKSFLIYNLYIPATTTTRMIFSWDSWELNSLLVSCEVLLIHYATYIYGLKSRIFFSIQAEQPVRILAL